MRASTSYALPLLTFSVDRALWNAGDMRRLPRDVKASYATRSVSFVQKGSPARIDSCIWFKQEMLVGSQDDACAKKGKTEAALPSPLEDSTRAQYSMMRSTGLQREHVS
jgi:hypothetical protein